MKTRQEQRPTRARLGALALGWLAGGVIAALAGIPAPSAAEPAAPAELGRVAWTRNYDEALQAARASKKPMLVLFDEVPG
jgi:hypothetical protein